MFINRLGRRAGAIAAVALAASLGGGLVPGVAEPADAAPMHALNRVFGGSCGWQESHNASNVTFTADDYAYGADCTAVQARVRVYAGCGGCYSYVYGNWSAGYSVADAANSYGWAGGGSRAQEGTVVSGWSTH